MKEMQTPRKDLSNRRPKDSPSSSMKSSITDNSKKSQKVAKKNLNAVFSSVSEELLTDSSDFSPVSEVVSGSDVNQNGELSDSFEYLFAGVEGLEAMTPPESSASSKIAVIKDESLFDSGNSSKVFQSEGCIDADVVANVLKKAIFEVSSSNDVSVVSKKLLDLLVEVSVKGLCGLPEEKDVVSVLISNKTRVLGFCFSMWLIAMTVILMILRSSGSRSTSSFYLPPT